MKWCLFKISGPYYNSIIQIIQDNCPFYLNDRLFQGIASNPINGPLRPGHSRIFYSLFVFENIAKTNPISVEISDVHAFK